MHSYIVSGNISEFIHNLIQIVFVLLFPAFTIALCRWSKIFKFISPIIICYLAGIIAGNTIKTALNKEMLTSIYELSVCLAIPILLFSSNFIKWLEHSRTTFLSFFLAVVAVVLGSILTFYIFRHDIPGANKISGMLIGVYTGGTPNMSAIGLALKVKEEVFLLLNSADIFFSAIYFILLITVAKKFLGLFLPAYKGYESPGSEVADNAGGSVTISIKQRALTVFISIILSAAILGVAFAISFLFKGEVVTPIIILVITTLGIAFSFSKKVRSLKGTFDTAEYLLLIFAVAIGTLADFRELLDSSSAIFYYLATMLGFSISLHIILGSIFRIDTDTLIITSTAGIFGPAFIGPVANAIRNKQVIVPGITMGLLGYAIGNYLGIAVAWLLK
jgi:uncharacterized membrane protein